MNGLLLIRRVIFTSLPLFGLPVLISAQATGQNMASVEANTQLLKRNTFLEGFNAYQKGDYAVLQRKMNEVLNENPDTPLRELAYFWLSQSYYKTGNVSESQRYLIKLSEVNPDFPLKGLLNAEQQDFWASIKPAAPVFENYSTKTATSSTADSASVAPSDTAENIPATFDNKIIHVPVLVQSSAVLTVKDIIVGTSYIEIQTEGRLNSFKSFRQTRPERLIIDIIDAKSRVSARTIAVNQFGISRIRIGNHPDSVRIVLDAEGSSFPVNKISSTEKGIHIGF